MRFLWIVSIVSGAIGVLLALMGILGTMANLDGRDFEDLVASVAFTIIGIALATVPYALISSIEKIRALGPVTADEGDTEEG